MVTNEALGATTGDLKGWSITDSSYQTAANPYNNVGKNQAAPVVDHQKPTDVNPYAFKKSIVVSSRAGPAPQMVGTWLEADSGSVHF